MARTPTEQTPPEGVEPVGPEARPPRKSLGRRVLKWSLWTLLGLVVLVGAGLLFLHTGPGQDLVRGIVEGKLNERMNGSARLGRLEFALFGDVHLGDLSLATPDGQEAVKLEALDVQLDWGSLTSDEIHVERLAIKGVRLNVTANADGTTSLTGLFKPPPQPAEPAPPPSKGIRLDALEVSDVAVALTQPDGTKVDLSGIEVAGNVLTTVAPQGLELKLPTLAASADVKRGDGTHLVVPKLGLDVAVRVAGDKVEARLTGLNTPLLVQRPGDAAPKRLRLGLGEITVTKAGGDISATLTKLAAGAVSVERIGVDAHLDDAMKPKGAQTVEVSGMVLTAKDMNDLVGRQVVMADVMVRFKATGPPERLVLDGEVSTRGGTLGLTGTVDASDPLEPKYDLTVSADNVRTAELLVGARIPVSASVVMKIKGKGLRQGDVDTTIDLDSGKIVIAGKTLDGVEMDVRAVDGAVQLDKLVLKALGHELKVAGRVDPASRKIRARLTTTADLAKLVDELNNAGVFKAPLPLLTGEDLAVDLTLEGVLAEPPKPGEPQGLPVEDATLKGTIGGINIGMDGRRIGGLDVSVDLTLKDGQPSGMMELALRDVAAGKLKLSTFRSHLDLQGSTYTLKLDGERQDRDESFSLEASGTVDPETMAIDASLRRLAVAMNGLEARLVDPVRLELPPGMDLTADRIRLPPVRVATAGGEIAVSGNAKLFKTGNEAKPLGVEDMAATITLAGIRFSKLPARVRRKLKMSGGIDGVLRVSGTPEQPALSFDVTTRAKGFKVAAKGGLADNRLELDARIHGRGGPLGRIEVSAPIRMKPKPGLGSGRLRVAIDAPDLRLAGLAPALAKKVGPDATVSADIALEGTAARPRGHVDLRLDGLKLEKLGDVAATLKASLEPDGRATTLDGDVAVSLNGEPLLKTRKLAGRFARSPIVSRTADFDFEVALEPLRLAALPLPDKVRDLTGTLEGGFEAHRVKRKLSAAYDLRLRGVGLPGKVGPLDVSADGRVGADGIALGGSVAGPDGPLATLAVAIPKTVKELQRLARRAKRSKKPPTLPLSVALTLPKTSLASLKKIAPTLPDMPALAWEGDLAVSGTTAKPIVAGRLALSGLATEADPNAALVMSLAADAASIGASLGLTGVDVPFVDLALDRAEVEAFAQGKASKLTVPVVVRANRLDLKRLIPAGAVDPAKLKLEGVMNADLKAVVPLERDEDGKLRKPEPVLSGTFGLADMALTVAALNRTFHDIGLGVRFADGAILLEGLSVRESDEEKQNRALDVTGRVALDGLKPQATTLNVKMKDFLAVGDYPDAPEGEVTMDATLGITGLDQPVKVVNVDIASLDLHRPHRYIRDHWQQSMGLNDIVEIDGPEQVGKLPIVKPKFFEGLPAEPPPGTPDEGVDVHVRMPKDGGKVLNHPLTLVVKGDIHAKIRPGAVALNGRIDMVEGTGSLLGYDFELREGAAIFDGPISNFRAYMDFVRTPGDPLRRDMVVPDPKEVPSRFGLRIAPATGITYDLGGASGPFLVDVMSVQIAGRSRWLSGPGFPASSTPQWPHGEAPLILAFVNGNLQHLIGLDRSSAWATPGVVGLGYGQLRWFEGTNYNDDETARLRLVSRDPRTSQSTFELQYDWFLTRTPRTILGAGLRAGSAGQAGAELFVEWSSTE